MNGNLHAAKRSKADEFYTRYEDIAAELAANVAHDPGLFPGATVLLPCDDWEWSQFTAYFLDHFDEYAQARLISTCRVEGGRGKILDRTTSGTMTGLLAGDGDFRSPEVTALRGQADFIITNPPFSLFREFLKWTLA